jgi:hypothetical protein
MPLIHDDFTYTEADHTSYTEQGYRIFDHFLSEDGLATCRTEIDAIFTRLEPGRDHAQIYSAHQQEPWMFDLARDPAILDMLEHQIGPNIVLWSSHLICKAPGTGITIPWHQDAPYWNVKGVLPAGIWIAFDDMDEDNGAMSVLPGWHTKGKLPTKPNPDCITFDTRIDPAALPENANELRAQYRMPAGGAAIHDTMIPHVSRPNVSERWRRVLVLRYIRADAELGDKEYEDYRDGSSFPRRFFLVRGEDTNARELETTPF